MLYIAVDPGKVTGIALYDGDSAPVAYEVPAAETGQFVWSRISRGDQVAMERYTITPGVKSAQPDALMVMGAVELVCRMHGVPFSYYTPGMGKRVGSNDVLRKLGWWQPTKDGHANDGKRVLLAHLAVKHPELFGRLTGI